MRGKKDEYRRMWEGRYSLTYCELKARAYSYVPFTIGGEYRNYIYVFQNQLLQAYAPCQEIEQLKQVRYALLMDPESCRTTLSESRKICEDQDLLSNEIASLDFQRFSNCELADIYESFMLLQQRNQVAFTVSQPEMLAFLERDVEEYVSSIAKSDAEFQEHIFMLTVPTRKSQLVDEEIAWNNIVLYAIGKPSVVALSAESRERFAECVLTAEPSLLQSISSHIDRYGWLPTQESNEPWTEVDKINLLHEELKRSSSEITERAKQAEVRFERLQAQREDLLPRLLPSPRILYQSLVLRELAALRWDLRFVRTRADFIARPLRKEIADRMGLNPYELEHLLLKETYSFLRHGLPFDKNELKRRLSFYIWKITDGNSKIYTGDQALEIFDHLLPKEDYSGVFSISGRSASQGYVRGTVRKISTSEKALQEAVSQMKKGEILVTGQTRPQLIIACRKAGAIVTDEGGIASHASVISRELGIPCIVGTKDGTKILHDGDIVEVDARQYKGVDRIIRSAELTIDTDLLNHVYIKNLSAIALIDQMSIGGKAWGLGKLIQAGFPVPPGFVITTAGVELGIEALTAAIMKALHALHCSLFAVRSSAVGEDSLQHSFAGQFDSFLNVEGKNVPDVIQKCLNGLQNDRVASYCETRGIDINSIKLAVIVQEMVPADLSGVCFTADPSQNDPHRIQISACYGLGEALVSGLVTPDEYVISEHDFEIEKREIAQQDFKLEFRAGQKSRTDVHPSMRAMQKLNDDQLRLIATLCNDIKKTLGYEVEVEWCIYADRPYFLQARPITTIRQPKTGLSR